MDYDLDMAEDQSLDKLKGEVIHSIADIIQDMAADGRVNVT